MWLQTSLTDSSKLSFMILSGSTPNSNANLNQGYNSLISLLKPKTTKHVSIIIIIIINLGWEEFLETAGDWRRLERLEETGETGGDWRDWRRLERLEETGETGGDWRDWRRLERLEETGETGGDWRDWRRLEVTGETGGDWRERRLDWKRLEETGETGETGRD